ncbi:IS66 Orf2 like protein [Pseudorhodobacter antarcticus]|uniref:IS66 Orf2 like protein n=2 Tax=Pseudorhodobacter antarcticus TaxID=1077947 RepID=A0A1H8MKZ3_9RHOB|nr:IS66 Orf2 like protein [Pseudorhodobacter antarcticus]
MYSYEERMRAVELYIQTTEQLISVWLPKGLGSRLIDNQSHNKTVAARAMAERKTFGHLFVAGGRRGDLLKIIWWDTQGACLFMKRLEKGRFVWPSAKDGKICVTAAQLSMLLEGIDWRMPARTWRP